MLRAGAYFPPSRNGRSWSPSAAAPGHQERLALVMGDCTLYFYTPSASLVPLIWGQLWILLLPNQETVMHDATTPPRAGEVSVGRRGDIHRQVLPPLRFARPPKRGTVMRNARRSCIKIHFPSADDADNADFSSLYYTEWLLLSAQSA